MDNMADRMYLLLRRATADQLRVVYLVACYVTSGACSYEQAGTIENILAVLKTADQRKVRLINMVAWDIVHVSE